MANINQTIIIAGVATLTVVGVLLVFSLVKSVAAPAKVSPNGRVMSVTRR